MSDHVCTVRGWNEDEVERHVARLIAERDAAEAKVAAVRELHFERKGVCWTCPQYDWPCSTAQALDLPAAAAVSTTTEGDE